MCERFDRLEGIIDDAVGKTASDIESLKAAQAKQVREFEAVLLTRQEAANERVGTMERALGSSLEGQARDLAAAVARLNELQGRLRTCEEQSASAASAAGNLQTAHRAGTSEAAALSTQLTSVKERIGSLEGRVRDAASKSVAEADGLRNAQLAHAKEIEAVRVTLASHSSLADRVDRTEKALGRLADTHGEDLAATRAKLEQMASRLSANEAQITLAEEGARKAQAAVAQEGVSLQAQQVSLRERLGMLEGLLSELAERHAGRSSTLDDAQAKSARELEAVRAAQAQHVAAVRQRLDALERSLSGPVECQAKELAAAAAKLEQLQGRITTCEAHGAAIEDLRRSQGLAAHAKAELEAHHASLKERMDQVESLLNMLSDSASKYAKEAEAFKVIHSKRVKELDTGAAALAAYQASMAERLTGAERLLAEAGERHSAELAAAGARMDQLHGRLLECEEQIPAVRSLRLAQAAATSEGESLRTQQAALRDRVEALEAGAGDAEARHAAAAEALRSGQARHARELEGLRGVAGQQSALAERLNCLERGLGDSAERQAQELGSTLSRLDQLGDRLAACEAHGATIGDLRRAQTTLAPMVDRLSSLERSQQELRAAQAELEKMRSVLSTVRRAWDHEVSVPNGHGNAWAGISLYADSGAAAT